MSNELTTIQEQPTASLVEIRRDNLRFPRLHSYPPEVAIRLMTACVLRAAKYFDAQVQMDEVNQTAYDLYTELMADVEGLRMQNITFEEISRAIRKAATGNSVEYYGRLSFHFLYKCIMQYARTEVLEANRQMLRLSESERADRYGNRVTLITGSATRQMLENTKGV